jgi:O-methyltransferase involved in polyketide biosynthesis
VTLRVGYTPRVPADVSRISVTAKVAAYYRQFSDIAFAGEVAKRIGADEAFDAIVREHGLEREKLTFYAPMFEARYKSISHLIGKSGCSQVLEIASGYSLRGLDLTQDSAVRYVETDLPDVVATKLTLLDDVRRQHGISPSPRHVVTVANALDFEVLRSAAEGLDHGLPLMVLCEGLIGYLTREETERLASNVRALLGAFGGGSWICPDFSFKTELGSLPPERVRLREAITGVTERQLDASAFEDERDLGAFLARVGFDVGVRSQIDEAPALASISALGLPSAWGERMRGILRVWVMTPAARS